MTRAQLFSKVCKRCEDVMNICPIEIYNTHMENGEEIQCPLWMLYYDYREELIETIKEELEDDSKDFLH